MPRLPPITPRARPKRASGPGECSCPRPDGQGGQEHPSRARAPRGRRGFTLLEVLVAVALLGLGLTAILTSQAGAIASSKRARTLSQATGLARCKMTELELQVRREGFQELDVAESGPCCGEDEFSGFRCSWKLDRPELPEPNYGDLDLDTDIGSSDLGGLGVLRQGEQGKQVFDPDAGASGVAETLAGGAAGAASGIVGTVMQMVYPDLKAILDASTRKATVTISWNEGGTEQSFDVVQWLTIPRPAPILDPSALDPSDDLSGAGSPASPASPASPGGRGR